METSLHRQLKLHYAATEEQTEVSIDGFRIDAISHNGELIEIQHASLGALRDKTKRLLTRSRHALRIVKPIIARKRVITLKNKLASEVLRSRMSPKRGELLDLFLDMVHFSTVFPRPRLTLEFVLIEAAETRVDRPRPTRRRKKYIPVDQQLVHVGDSIELCTKGDLLGLLPLDDLPSTFDTAELAAALQRPRWFAQKVAYCLRQTGAAKLAGKRGHSQLYRIASRRRKLPRVA